MWITKEYPPSDIVRFSRTDCYILFGLKQIVKNLTFLRKGGSSIKEYKPAVAHEVIVVKSSETLLHEL
jgi:hypothetical protein